MSGTAGTTGASVNTRTPGTAGSSALAPRRTQHAERVALHSQAGLVSIGASALLGVAFVTLVWRADMAGHLVLGLGALLCTQALVGWRYVRTHAADTVGGGQGLRSLRTAAALHGLGWAFFEWQVMPGLDVQGFTLLLYTQTAFCAGALLTTRFDRVSTIAFVFPSMAPLGIGLAVGQRPAPGVAWIALVLIGAAGLSSALRLRREASVERAREEERAQLVRLQTREAEQARTALAAKHEMLSLVLHNTQQGYWSTDIAGVTLDVNPSMCALLGRPREAVIGQPIEVFFDGEALSRLRSQTQTAPEGGHRDGEIEIRRPDGSVAHCLLSTTEVTDAAGRQAGHVGFWTDITARRQHEAELQTYERVANSIADMVSVVSEDGIYRMVNDAWCARVGIAREAAIGRNSRDVMPGVYSAQRVQAFRECLDLREPRAVRAAADLAGCDQRHYETVYHPYDDRNARWVVIVTRDVTEQEGARLRLAASEEYLRRTLNATGDAIFASDSERPGDPVRFVNDQMLQMWGIPAHRVTHLTPAHIMDHALALFEEPQAQAQKVQAIIERNEWHEDRLALRDGRVLLRRCIPATAGHSRLRVWSFRDVTAEERALQLARHSEAEMRTLLDAFPGFIAAVDENFRYTYINDRLAGLFETPPQRIMGRHMRDVLGEERFQEVAPSIRLALAGQVNQEERHYPATARRGRIDIQVTHVASAPGQTVPRLCYGFGQDVTARNRADEALIAARDEAQDANRAKSKFLSQMSHELRTPLNAILGFAQLLASDHSTPLAPPHRAYVDELLQGGRHLLGLINDILDLGRIEAGQMELTLDDVPLGEILQACLGMLRPLADERDVVLPLRTAVAPSVNVVADRKRLTQVLLNLLANAIKYNRQAGEVSIECRDEGERIWIGVRDTGPGVSPSEQARLFQPFERLGAAGSGVEGTGIGLALSRQLVEAMGGSMGVDSETGVGSLFWLRLPHSQAARVRPHQPAASAPDPAAADRSAIDAAVLYIEDNAVNVMIMEAVFAAIAGVRLICAATPSQGLDLARSVRPALILLDIQLPEIDGKEVLRRLRSDPATRAIPVVAVSANAMPEEVDALLAAGAQAYLTKPIDVALVVSTVRRLVAPARPPAG